MTDDSLNDLVVQCGIAWRNVAREERPFVHEQQPIMLQVDTRSGAQAVHARQKTNIALVPAARRRQSFIPAQLIEVMDFFYGGHPKIGMRCKLAIKPRRPTFLGPDTQEIGPCLARRKSVALFLAAVADMTSK